MTTYHFNSDTSELRQVLLGDSNGKETNWNEESQQLQNSKNYYLLYNLEIFILVLNKLLDIIYS